jgi:hypothetical protein
MKSNRLVEPSISRFVSAGLFVLMVESSPLETELRDRWQLVWQRLIKFVDCDDRADR